MAYRNTTLYRLALHITDLLDLPLDRHGEPRKAFEIIRAVGQAMTNGLQRGEEITVRGFGKFIIHTPSGVRRTGNNIITQDGTRSPVVMEHKPRKRVKFIPSEQLEAMLNKGVNWDEKRAMELWNK